MRSRFQSASIIASFAGAMARAAKPSPTSALPAYILAVAGMNVNHCPIHKYRQSGFVEQAPFTVSVDFGGYTLMSEAATLKVKYGAGN